MCLSSDVRSLSLEEGSGRSPFPSTLMSLLLGPRDTPSVHEKRPSLFDPSAALAESIDCAWTRLREADWSDEECRRILQARSGWLGDVRHFTHEEGPFDCLLPPGLLPHGLRRLQFAKGYDSLLLPGSIPSTVEILQLHSLQPASISWSAALIAGPAGGAVGIQAAAVAWCPPCFP
jgi:hypothetical protein